MQFSCLPSSRNPASSTSRINFCKAFATAEYSRARGKNYAPFMESNRRTRVAGAVTGRAAGIPAVARRFSRPPAELAPPSCMPVRLAPGLALRSFTSTERIVQASRLLAQGKQFGDF